MHAAFIRSLSVLVLIVLFVGGSAISPLAKDTNSLGPEHVPGVMTKANLQTIVSIMGGVAGVQDFSSEMRAQAIKPLAKFLLQEVIILKERGIVSQSMYENFENGLLSTVRSVQRDGADTQYVESEMDRLVADLEIKAGEKVPFMMWPPRNCTKCLDINFAKHYNRIVISKGRRQDEAIRDLAKELSQTDARIGKGDVGSITSQANKRKEVSGEGVILIPGHRDYVKN